MPIVFPSWFSFRVASSLTGTSSVFITTKHGLIVCLFLGCIHLPLCSYICHENYRPSFVFKLGCWKISKRYFSFLPHCLVQEQNVLTCPLPYLWPHAQSAIHSRCKRVLRFPLVTHFHMQLEKKRRILVYLHVYIYSVCSRHLHAEHGTEPFS